MIDLHMHSTFSDGTCSPEELVALAKGFGLTAIALTDHDTVAGVPRFLSAGAATGQRVLSGVEISAAVDRGALHILGYHIDPTHAGLLEGLRRIREGRVERNQKILARLNDLGFEVSWDAVTARAGEGVMGRPHFAMALVERAYVPDKQTAFDRYLAKGAPAYVERYRMTPREGLALIRAAGGVPVLAHPFTLGLGKGSLKRCVKELKADGLMGIEVYYSEHNTERTKVCLSLAESLDLVPTGGSDFHGEMNPAIRMGIGFGGLRVPDDVVDRLDACRSSV